MSVYKILGAALLDSVLKFYEQLYQIAAAGWLNYCALLRTLLQNNIIVLFNFISLKRPMVGVQGAPPPTEPSIFNKKLVIQSVKYSCFSCYSLQ